MESILNAIDNQLSVTTTQTATQLLQDLRAQAYVANDIIAERGPASVGNSPDAGYEEAGI